MCSALFPGEVDWLHCNIEVLLEYLSVLYLSLRWRVIKLSLKFTFDFDTKDIFRQLFCRKPVPKKPVSSKPVFCLI